MPIRRLNYTKRKKLTREQAVIRLLPNSDGEPRSFTAVLNLPEGLPGSARVFIEAYRSSPAGRMRFDFGTVDAIRSPGPDEVRLSDFHDDLPPPLFRVKVTDADGEPGKLLAEAHQLHPVDPDENPDQRRGILFTAWRDNNGLPWELDLTSDEGPRLYIDSTADPHRELPGKGYFKALVYPEVVRRVLSHIVIEHGCANIDDPSSWHGAWFRFPREMFGFTELLQRDDSEQAHDWIDNAVRWCSRKVGFVQALAPGEETS